MLTQNIIENIVQNRRSEKNIVQLERITSKLGFCDYQNIIDWFLEACNNLQLNPATRYLTRVYFDQVFNFYQNIDKSQFLPLGIVCMSFAIKFNESREFSDRVPLSSLYWSAELKVSGDESLNYELKVLTALGFKFKYTTPYDFIEPFVARFPWYPQIIPVIMDVLNVMVTLVEGCQYTAQQLFYGSLQAIFVYKKAELTNVQKNVLNSLTDCWTSANQLSKKVLNKIQLETSNNSPQ